MLPELAAWFGIRPWEVDELTAGEIDVLIGRLKQGVPPIGGVVLYERKR